MFEYCGHIHVYSPRAGADNLPRYFFFHKHKFSVHLHTPSKFPPFTYTPVIFRNKLTTFLVFEQSSLARNRQLDEFVHIIC